METTKSEFESDKVKETNYEIEEAEKKDLTYTKTHHNLAYKILKYNPIDPISDLYRKFLKSFNFLDRADELHWWITYATWCKFWMRVLWRWEKKGELCPEWGSGIVVGNHQSHLDPFFIGGAVHRRIQWMSKLENFKTPIVRTLFENLGAFRLDRDNPTPGMDKAKEILRNGGWVGIFPEATRSPDGKLAEEFKTGAVRLAIEMQVPIVPTAVIGSENALPKGKLVMKPTKVFTRVGKAIYYDDYDIETVTFDEIQQLTNELRETIANLIEGKESDDKIEKEEELSIGSPKDLEDKPKKFNFLKEIKKIGIDAVKQFDDFWYGTLRALEVFGLRHQVEQPLYYLTGHILTAYTNLMNPIRVIDFDKNLPKEGGALIACGHNSEWDVLMLPYAIWLNGRRELWQMSKESLFKIPFVNAWVRTHHAFPLKRGESDVHSYIHAKQCLEEGKLVVVYPEGTTNSGGGELLEGHTGAVRLAIEAKVPIIPVGVTGTENIYPKHGKMLNFGNGCIMKAGKPFMEHQKYWDKTMPEYDELKKITDNMMEEIKNLMFYDDPLA